ncbi:MAG TPA: LysM peptidoglycan-binding domain-containing protein [Candidatus Acidoferrales bacterium]|jgi:LysM repeat protein|nr:LysM peptidoglycan-binding domain-containing protein [Candidatus Acidoferrales bacterium]
MNNPNPFVPKGSLLEKQGQRRSHLKIAVSCVLAVSILSLVAMLIQGCKRDQPPADLGVDTNAPVMTDTNTPPVDTNAAALPPMGMPTNTAPVVVPPPVVEPPVTPGSEYVVVKSDTLTTIAKAHHVTLKDLQTANPGVDSKHLKIGQKLVIPASTAMTTAAPTTGTSTADAGGDTYTVKSGDTLTTIAKKHGTTIKALQAANSLTTTKIKVGQKLKLPAAATVAPAPVETTAPAPAPMTLPASTPAPAPSK